MSAGDVNTSTVVGTAGRQNGTVITATLLGITGASVDPTKLAAAYVTITSQSPSGAPIVRKAGINAAVLADSSGNTTCAFRLKRHAANAQYSPLIRKSDTDSVTLTMPLATITGTGGSSAALAGAAVTNSSSLPMPKASGGWAMHPRMRYAGHIDFYFWANGVDGWPTVELYKGGATLGGSTTLVATMAAPEAVPVDSRVLSWAESVGAIVPTSGNVYLYHTRLDISNTATYPDGARCFSMRIVPRIGDANSYRDGRPDGFGEGSGVGEIILFINSGGTLTQHIRYVSSSGNDSNNGLTVGTPKRTVQPFIDDGAVNQNGLIIKATGAFTDADLLFTGNINSEFITIEGQSGATWVPGIVRYWNPGTGGGAIRLKDLKIKVSLASILEMFVEAQFRKSGANALVMVRDGCECYGDDRTTAGGFFYDPEFDYLGTQNCYIHDMPGVCIGEDLAVGVAWNSIYVDAMSNTSAFTMVYGNGLDTGGAHLDYYQATPGARRTTNCWRNHSSALNVDSTGNYSGVWNIDGGYSDDDITNFFAHITDPDAPSQSVFNGNSQMIRHNLTMVNDGVKFYNTGADGSGFNADNASILSYTARQFQYQNAGDEPETAHVGHDNYGPVFQGVEDDSYDHTTENDNAVLFTDPDGTDYSPNATGPLVNRIPAGGALWPADFNGVPYKNDGTDAIGAYNGQIGDTPPPPPPPPPPPVPVGRPVFIGGSAGIGSLINVLKQPMLGRSGATDSDPDDPYHRDVNLVDDAARFFDELYNSAVNNGFKQVMLYHIVGAITGQEYPSAWTAIMQAETPDRLTPALAFVRRCVRAGIRVYIFIGFRIALINSRDQSAAHIPDPNNSSDRVWAEANYRLWVNAGISGIGFDTAGAYPDAQVKAWITYLENTFGLSICWAEALPITDIGPGDGFGGRTWAMTTSDTPYIMLYQYKFQYDPFSRWVTLPGQHIRVIDFSALDDSYKNVAADLQSKGFIVDIGGGVNVAANEILQYVAQAPVHRSIQIGGTGIS